MNATVKKALELRGIKLSSKEVNLLQFCEKEFSGQNFREHLHDAIKVYYDKLLGYVNQVEDNDGVPLEKQTKSIL